MKTTLDHALHYANHGIAVLPLHYLVDGKCSCKGTTANCKPGKHPYGALVRHGLKDATTDQETIKNWFTNKSYNIGIVTGKSSGFFVLDRDDRDGGNQTLKMWQEQNSPLPETLKQITGNGVHYFFKVPDGVEIRNFQKKTDAPGIDVRGEGGYVCAAPSIHQNGNQYHWDEIEFMDTQKITNAPSWLIEKILSKPGSKPTADISDLKQQKSAFLIPEKITDGEGRESFILSYAGHLRIIGLDQLTIERTLLDYNQLHIEPPLAKEEVLAKSRRYMGDVADSPSESSGSPWESPKEVKSSLPAVPEFDYELLPIVFRDWVKDIAECMQCPPDFLAVGAMVVAGSIIGNKIGVQPKQLDSGWVEVPNIWGAVVGRPGVMKTPALAKIMLPLKELEREARDTQTKAMQQFKLEKILYEAKLKSIKTSINKVASLDNIELPMEPEEPKAQRYVVNDATYQKLGEVLQSNPDGLMAFQDELVGLLMRLDADGQESARAFYLQAWDGKQSYTFDRIERGTTAIDRLCFSVLGGIQPGKIRDYLRSAINGGKGDDGLVQRIQLLVYPDVTKEWIQVDRHPNLAAIEAAHDVCKYLAKLNPAEVGATESPIGIYVLKFSLEAQNLFNRWWSQLESNLRNNSIHPALESHYSKYRKLIPSLALLDHLINLRVGEIQKDSVLRAMKWHQYLKAHAKRAYGSVTSSSIDSAKALYEKLDAGLLKDGFSARDIYRKKWSMLTSVKEAIEAAETLVDLGWLQSYTDKIPGMDGRPTVRYIINPKLEKAA